MACQCTPTPTPSSPGLFLLSVSPKAPPACEQLRGVPSCMRRGGGTAIPSPPTFQADERIIPPRTHAQSRKDVTRKSPRHPPTAHILKQTPCFRRGSITPTPPPPPPPADDREPEISRQPPSSKRPPVTMDGAGDDKDDHKDFFPATSIHDADDARPTADTGRDDQSADFQLPLPPLSHSDGEFLRAVAARAEAAGRSGQPPPLLPRLIAAYTAEAAARRMAHGLAPVYQGYLLKMSDGVSVDELLLGHARGAVREMRKEKL
ncbi:hypothetical protein B0J12DRAFT_194252 [Macrophomina phaseolina]|uniref:Uncharacterized protein n=1 Tax=Macrophomina phaseolina TaxID=35725 RepID=A0ABQ8G430_9PEZI|nr:hypothetical protein B0J12DRAFT_194252 [Macrophomina phaseolina]